MKLDFGPFGGDSGGAPSNGTPHSQPSRFSQRLLQRYLTHRLKVRPLDDARDTVRTGVVAALLFFGLFLAAALFAPMSGAAVAEGQVTVSGDRIVIQPEDSALIAELLVEEGQVVREGQPLVRMNGMRSGARLRQAQARRDALRAVEARLIAERDGLDQVPFPADLAQRASDPAALAAMRAQQAIFARRQVILAADRTVSDAQLSAAAARRVATARQLALIEDELAGLRQLLARGFATRTRVRTLERTEAELQAEMVGGATATTEAEMNRRRTRDGQIVEVVTQLSQVQDQLAQINPELDVTRYEADRNVLRAPVSGRVAGVAQVGAGSVVSGGQTLMQVLPAGRALIVEARIKPEDIDDVQLGAEAHVRFTSANPRGRSSFTGRVVRLSPIQVTPEGGAANGGAGFFRAQIALDDPALAERNNIPLQPGLPATINITTARRSLWDYLMAPLSDAMNRSMREE